MKPYCETSHFQGHKDRINNGELKIFLPYSNPKSVKYLRKQVVYFVSVRPEHKNFKKGATQ